MSPGMALRSETGCCTLVASGDCSPYVAQEVLTEACLLDVDSGKLGSPSVGWNEVVARVRRTVKSVQGDVVR